MKRDEANLVTLDWWLTQVSHNPSNTRELLLTAQRLKNVQLDLFEDIVLQQAETSWDER